MEANAKLKLLAAPRITRLHTSDAGVSCLLQHLRDGGGLPCQLASTVKSQIPHVLDATAVVPVIRLKILQDKERCVSHKSGPSS